MNISEIISGHVLKINSQTRHYWQRSVSASGSIHTDRATPATFQPPGASPGQQLQAESPLLFSPGPGGARLPQLPTVVSAARVHGFRLRFTVVHGVGVGRGRGRTRTRPPEGSGIQGGDPPPHRKEAESALLVLPTPGLRPLDFPGRGRQQGSRVLLSGADGHLSVSPCSLRSKRAPPCLFSFVFSRIA